MAIKYYSSIDLNQNELQFPVIHKLGSAPTSPAAVAGQLYYDSGSNTLNVYNGSAWINVGGDITGVTAGTGLNGGGTTGAVTLNVDAAQTAITSIVNTSLVIGRDADNDIDFATDNQIIFRVGGGDNVIFKASGEIEATSLDISGGVVIDGTTTLAGVASFSASDHIMADGANINDPSDNLMIGFATNAVTLGSPTIFDSTLTIASDIIHKDDTNNKISFGTDTQTFTTGGIARLTITDATSTISNNLIVSGDLTVSGDTISANVGTLNVEDKNITLNQSSSDSSSTADGAGITIQDAVNADTDATLLWNAASDKFVFSHLIEAPGTSIFTNLDISGDVDVDGTLETDALTINGTAIVAQATTSAVGGVELATAAEVITGTDAARVVTADTLSAKSVVADIVVSSLTDANIVTITHNLGTADIMVQVYDKTTEANIMCDIARTTDDFSTASTSVVSIDFGTAPPNDCRALITSLAGATAGSIAYT